MPLTKKGETIKAAMVKEYGKKRGTSVFYASRNSGRIVGVEKGFRPPQRKTIVGQSRGR